MPGDETTDALNQFASGVTVLTIRDGMDDLAATVSAFLPISTSPPLVAVSLSAGGYLADVLERHDEWGVSILAESQRVLAGRFSAAGRPSPRLLLDDTPHHRGAVTNALLIDSGLAAFECRTTERVPAGDHLLVVGEILDVAHITSGELPLIRHQRAYRGLRA